MTDAEFRTLADKAGTPALRQALAAALAYREAMRVMGVDPEKIDRALEGRK